MMKKFSFVVLAMAVILCVSIAVVSSENVRVGQWSNKMARYTVRMVPIEKVEAQVEDQILGKQDRFAAAPMWPAYGYYRRAPYPY